MNSKPFKTTLRLCWDVWSEEQVLAGNSNEPDDVNLDFFEALTIVLPPETTMFGGSDIGYVTRELGKQEWEMTVGTGASTINKTFPTRAKAEAALIAAFKKGKA